MHKDCKGNDGSTYKICIATYVPQYLRVKIFPNYWDYVTAIRVKYLTGREELLSLL